MVVVADVERLVEVEHCGVVVESSWAVEHLEREEVRLVVEGLMMVPVVEMVVVWESSLERSAEVLL